MGSRLSRIHSSHASASLRQREGFSLSTVSIDHILHGLRRACIVGQKEKGDWVNDTQVCSLHPRTLAAKTSWVCCTAQDTTTGATVAEHVVYFCHRRRLPNTSAPRQKPPQGKRINSSSGKSVSDENLKKGGEGRVTWRIKPGVECFEFACPSPIFFISLPYIYASHIPPIYAVRG